MNERFRPYSERRGVAEPFRFHEGIPEHLRAELETWAWEQVRVPVGYGYRAGEDAVDHVISSLQMPIRAQHANDRWVEVTQYMGASDDVFLDVLDLLLDESNHEDLEARLNRGMSLHSVVSDPGFPMTFRLEARVTDGARKTYESALAEGGDIADDLSEAWRRAFGRESDPSDAWQHAVRAIEGVMWQVVTPNAARARFGQIVTAIRDAPGKWEFAISDGDDAGDGSQILPVLDLIGYDPGRHPGGGSKASLKQARAVVVLASTVVEWVRQGAFKRVGD